MISREEFIRFLKLYVQCTDIVTVGIFGCLVIAKK